MLTTDAACHRSLGPRNRLRGKAVVSLTAASASVFSLRFCRVSDVLINRCQPQLMGIVNVTPDSFSDGHNGHFIDQAIAHAQVLLDEGADILDIGGESTRPGAVPVPAHEEKCRVLPVIEALAQMTQRTLSVDTSKPVVMEAAVTAGARMINDVRALRATGALTVAAQLGVPVVLMHMQGDPATMQRAPTYNDVVSEVLDFIVQRIDTAVSAGIDFSRLIIDPGFGFGKTSAHNFALLAALERFNRLNVPVLVGLSRKRSLGELTGRHAPKARVFASVAAHLIAVQRGASIVRVHDVGATKDALQLWSAVQVFDRLPADRHG